MSTELEHCTIAIAVASRGTEQVELEQPRRAIEAAGGRVELVGAQAETAQTVNNDLDPGDTFEVDKAFFSVSAADYDGLVVPGGTVGADSLRGNSQAIQFIRGFFEQAKPVGVICHGPWTLVKADVVRGRILTSYPTLQTDIRNAGGTWVDEEVVTDQGLITSRTPDDLPVFCARIVNEFARSKADEHPRSS